MIPYLPPHLPTSAFWGSPKTTPMSELSTLQARHRTAPRVGPHELHAACSVITELSLRDDLTVTAMLMYARALGVLRATEDYLEIVADAGNAPPALAGLAEQVASALRVARLEADRV